MSSAEIKRFVFATMILGSAIMVVLIWLVDSMTFGLKTLSRVPVAATITTAFWLLYFRWGWKWWPLKYLFRRPRVDGTWIGHLESDWTRKGANSATLVPIAFVIKQSFFTLVVRSFTRDRQGNSDVANLIVKDDADIVYVSYVYALREEFVAGTGAQQGAGELQLVNKDTELRGEYWTNTKTRGRLLVQRQIRNRISSFAEAESKWPISSWPKFDSNS